MSIQSQLDTMAKKIGKLALAKDQSEQHVIFVEWDTQLMSVRLQLRRLILWGTIIEKITKVVITSILWVRDTQIFHGARQMGV